MQIKAHIYIFEVFLYVSPANKAEGPCMLFVRAHCK